MTSARANRRGMFAVAGAMATFSVNDMLMKLTAPRYPLGEVIAVRGLIASLMVAAILIATGSLATVRLAGNRLLVFRTLLDGAAMVLFTGALIHMPLAELSATESTHEALIAAGVVGALLPIASAADFSPSSGTGNAYREMLDTTRTSSSPSSRSALPRRSASAATMAGSTGESALPCMMAQ